MTAWADEMLCADGDESACQDGTRIHLLGGFLGTADIFDHLTERLGISPGGSAYTGALRAAQLSLTAPADAPWGT